MKFVFLGFTAIVASSLTVDVEDRQSCIEEKCPTQWAKCVPDAKCTSALSDCDKKCGSNTACWTLCLPSKGSQSAIDVAKCGQANGCDKAKFELQTVDDRQSCIEEKCPTQWAKCVPDAKCTSALSDCDKKCGSNTACWTLCLPSKGSQSAIDVAKCGQANGCDKAKFELQTVDDRQSCIEEKCPTQWAKCVPDAKCTSALSDCDKKCGSKTACWTLCLPSKGSQSAIDVAKCGQANGCDKAKVELQTVDDRQSCIEEKCPTQWAKCVPDAKCTSALSDCDKKCGSNTACWTLCLPSKGSQSAIDVAKCGQANGCDKAKIELMAVPEVQDLQTCIEEKCPNEWAACQTDPKCVPALQDCEKKCGTKASCWTLCLPGKGSQPAINVAKCAQANHCV